MVVLLIAELRPNSAPNVVRWTRNSSIASAEGRIPALQAAIAEELPRPRVDVFGARTNGGVVDRRAAAELGAERSSLDAKLLDRIGGGPDSSAAGCDCGGTPTPPGGRLWSPNEWWCC